MRQVAFRLLGSRAEADDAVQAAWLKLSRTCRSRARRWPAEAIWVVRREPQRRADRADYVPASMKAGGTLGPSTIPAPR
jgi:hypothetical protein